MNWDLVSYDDQTRDGFVLHVATKDLEKAHRYGMNFPGEYYFINVINVIFTDGNEAGTLYGVYVKLNGE